MTALVMASLPRPSTPPDPSAMHIDLSDVPPLVTPSPPSNTLLVTNLHNPAIFAPASLQAIRAHLEAECARSDDGAALYSFAPLKSMRRIVVAFTATAPAVALRQQLDGTDLLGCRIRLYFGAPTPIDAAPTHLAAPAADKLFFISPPPSPPHGWTMRNEEPPNKEVYAADLADALANLEAHHRLGVAPEDTEMVDAGAEGAESVAAAAADSPRRRQGSTVVFQPETHGGSPGLPAVMVEDTTLEGVQLEGDRRILEHTARPPVELMD